MKLRICIKYSLIFLFVSVVNMSENITTDNDTELNCVSKIAENITDDLHILIVTYNNKSVKLHIPAVIIDSTYNLSELIMQTQFNVFILIFNNLNEFQCFLEKIVLFRFWNPRGKFIVTILSNDFSLSEMFQIAWSYFIININVIKMKYTSAEIYTYYPYSREKCGNNTVPILLTDCHNTQGIDLYPSKIPSSFLGCTLKLIVSYRTPYVINIKSNVPSEAGIEVAMISAIAEKLQITKQYVAHHFKHRGYVFENRTCTNLYGVVNKKEADIMYGMTPFEVEENSNMFEASTTYLMEEFYWWVPVAKEIPKWMNLTKIFHFQLWLLLFGSVLINILIQWIFGTIIQNENAQLVNNIISSWAMLLQNSVQFPASRVMKTLFIFWITYCLLINTAYQSQLISILTKPHFEKQITNIREASESKLSFSVTGGTFYYYQKYYSAQTSYYILKNVIVWSHPRDIKSLNRTAFNRNMATIEHLRNTLHLAKKMYLDENGNLLIYGFRSEIIFLPRFIVAAGFPLLEKINTIILLLLSNGLIEKWENDIIATHRKVVVSDEPESLSTIHFAVAFLNLSIGLIISFVVFTIEIVLFQFSNSK